LALLKQGSPRSILNDPNGINQQYSIANLENKKAIDGVEVDTAAANITTLQNKVGNAVSQSIAQAGDNIFAGG
jgi:hypothetical protein